MPDVVTLRLPADDRALLLTGRLVVAGVASRLDLPVERLDDLQLAVETGVAGRTRRGSTTIEITVADPLRVSIGPIDEGGAVRPGSIGRYLLGKLVTKADVVERGGLRWLVLEQTIDPGPKAEPW
jgi:hypothetical protein